MDNERAAAAMTYLYLRVETNTEDTGAAGDVSGVYWTLSLSLEREERGDDEIRIRTEYTKVRYSTGY